MHAEKNEQAYIETLWREVYELYRSDDHFDHLALIQLAEKLLGMGGNSAEARARLNCLIADTYNNHLHEPPFAEAYYKLALKEDPKNARAGTHLGLLYISYFKDYPTAVKVLQRALDAGIASRSIRTEAQTALKLAQQKLNT
jgi:lipopolysaccharide biosynthesis regulator YciM